jgi:glutathione S-transferase
MSLTLYFHPLSSFCHKALVALYENDTPFQRRVVNLMDPVDAAAFKKLWPIGKFPVLRDDGADRTIPESSVIIEYLDQHYPGKAPLIPSQSDLGLQARAGDRFYDLYVQVPMQKVIGDRLRPADKKDAHGVEQAMAQLKTALGLVEDQMAGKTWAVGNVFSIADCAATPALFYADMLVPLAGSYNNAAAYLDRLKQRPSIARVLEEAKPYFSMIPK